jgi:general nucleoside transport system permease protein
MIDLITGILSMALLAGGVLVLGALGEVLSERVGVFNLGLEGLMALGGVTAIITVAHVPSAPLGLLMAIIVGLLAGVIFSGAVVLARANQTLCGLALTIAGTGLAAAAGRSYSGQPAKAIFDTVTIPYLSDLPIIGRAIFSQNPLVYVIWIVLPIALHFLLFKTRHGINLRAVGENPSAADAAGVPVTLIRFCYVVIGAGFAGAAGGYLTLAFVPSWSDGITGGRGWIAVALVIFAGFRPYTATLGAFLFGLITALGFVGQARNWLLPPAFLSMLPYVVTIACMIIPVIVSPRLQRRLAAPAALGVPYFRDQR